jgi:hypothetical protein
MSCRSLFRWHSPNPAQDSSATLRLLCREKDGSAARMLALAMVLEGADRKSAAESCGMDRHRDCVHRYNAGGGREHFLVCPRWSHQTIGDQDGERGRIACPSPIAGTSRSRSSSLRALLARDRRFCFFAAPVDRRVRIVPHTEAADEGIGILAGPDPFGICISGCNAFWQSVTSDDDPRARVGRWGPTLGKS